MKLVRPLFLLVISLGFFACWRKLFLTAPNFDIFPKLSRINLEKNYQLVPQDLQLGGKVTQPFPVIDRPTTPMGYFNDFLKDQLFFGNWEPLSYKKTTILMTRVPLVLQSYQNLEQLERWWLVNRPYVWDFTNYQKFYSWEGNLAEYYQLVSKEIDSVISQDENFYRKFEKLLKIGRVLARQKKEITDSINVFFPNSKDENDYLNRLVRDVYDNLFKKIYQVVPLYHREEIYFLTQPLVSEDEYGLYRFWLNGKALISEGVERVKLEILNSSSAGGEYQLQEENLNLGDFKIDKENYWVKVTLVRGENLSPTTAPILRLKKVGYLENGLPTASFKQIKGGKYQIDFANLSGGLKNLMVSSLGFGWKAKILSPSGLTGQIVVENVARKYCLRLGILFFLSAFLVLIGFSNITTLLKEKAGAYLGKLFGFFGRGIKIGKKQLQEFPLPPTFIYFLGLSVFIKNDDLFIVGVVLFWVTASIIWNFDGMFTLSLALILILICPVLILLKKEGAAENLALIIYFLLAITVFQQWLEFRTGRFDRDDWEVFLRKVVRNIVIWAGEVLFLYLIFKDIAAEVAYCLLLFEEHCGGQLAKRFIFKLPIFWLSAGTASLILYFLFSQKRLAMKILFFRKSIFVIMFLAIWLGNKMFFLKENRWMKADPFIAKIERDEVGLGNTFRLSGNNLGEKGRVIFNNETLNIINWDPMMISFKTEKDYSATFSSVLSVEREDGKTQKESNQLRFLLEESKE